MPLFTIDLYRRRHDKYTRERDQKKEEAKDRRHTQYLDMWNKISGERYPELMHKVNEQQKQIDTQKDHIGIELDRQGMVRREIEEILNKQRHRKNLFTNEDIQMLTFLTGLLRKGEITDKDIEELRKKEGEQNNEN